MNPLLFPPEFQLIKAKDELVIVPFGCVPLRGTFRYRKSNWEKCAVYSLRFYAFKKNDNWIDENCEFFREETLVATLKSYLSPDLYRHIVTI